MQCTIHSAQYQGCKCFIYVYRCDLFICFVTALFTEAKFMKFLYKGTYYVYINVLFERPKGFLKNYFIYFISKTNINNQ